MEGLQIAVLNQFFSNFDTKCKKLFSRKKKVLFSISLKTKGRQPLKVQFCNSKMSKTIQSTSLKLSGLLLLRITDIFRSSTKKGLSTERRPSWISIFASIFGLNVFQHLLLSHDLSDDHQILIDRSRTCSGIP